MRRRIAIASCVLTLMHLVGPASADQMGDWAETVPVNGNGDPQVLLFTVGNGAYQTFNNGGYFPTQLAVLNNTESDPAIVDHLVTDPVLDPLTWYDITIKRGYTQAFPYQMGEGNVLEGVYNLLEVGTFSLSAEPQEWDDNGELWYSARVKTDENGHFIIEGTGANPQGSNLSAVPSWREIKVYDVSANQEDPEPQPGDPDYDEYPDGPPDPPGDDEDDEDEEDPPPDDPETGLECIDEKLEELRDMIGYQAIVDLLPDSSRDFALEFEFPFPGAEPVTFTLPVKMTGDVDQTGGIYAAADTLRKWVRAAIGVLFGVVLLRSVIKSLRQY